MVVRQQCRDEARVADVALRERVTGPRQSLDVRQRATIAGVGQEVEVDDPVSRVLSEPIPDEVRANEARPPVTTRRTWSL